MTVLDFMTRGYFPEELPPSFDTLDFAKLNIADIEKAMPQKNTPKKCTPYSIPKIKAYRRRLGIPNPVSYFRLSKTIADNWANITTFTNSSTFSTSRLQSDVNSTRALFVPNFQETTNARIIKSIGYKHALKIDILNFYGTIYTHSIPWAYHGKELSKSKRKRNDLIGNAIDEDARNLQDGQTIGIPIGPDTSRVISEMIATRIDMDLKKEIPSIAGIRAVDDIWLYFKNLGDLEKARSVIITILKNFELELNPSKESIINLPEEMESQWYYTIKAFRFNNKRQRQEREIIAYFDMLFHYAATFPDDNIISFGITKIYSTIINKDSWRIFESLLLKIVLIEPKSIVHVVKLLIAYKSKGYILNITNIENALNSFLLNNLNLDNHFEISWTLWLYKQLNINVQKDISDIISQSNNSVVILTALDLRSAGLISHNIDTSLWESMLKQENLYQENWLFVYESLKKNWLSTQRQIIQNDPFFKLLYDNDVNFYKADMQPDISSIKISANGYFSKNDIDSISEIEENEHNSKAEIVYDDLPF